MVLIHDIDTMCRENNDIERRKSRICLFTEPVPNYQSQLLQIIIWTITITIKSIGNCAYMLVHRTCLQLSIAMLPIIIQTSIIEVGPLLFVIVIVAIVLSSPGLKEAKNFGPCALNSHHHNVHLSSHNSCNFQDTGGLFNAWAVCHSHHSHHLILILILIIILIILAISRRPVAGPMPGLSLLK